MKHLNMSNRDFELLKALSNFGILSSNQIHKLLFNAIDKSSMHRRLRDLEKAKLTKTVEGFNRGEHVKCLSKKGADLIGAKVYDVKLRKDVLIHDLLVNDLRIHLEVLGAGLFWQSGYVIKQELHKGKELYERSYAQIPDWFFSMQTLKGPKAVALEVEVSRKGKKRYEKILDTYSRVENLNHVWYLVRSKSLGEVIGEISTKLYLPKPKQWLFWSEINEVLQSPKNFRFYYPGGELSSEKVLTFKSGKTGNKPAHSDAHSAGTSNDKNQFCKMATL